MYNYGQLLDGTRKYVQNLYEISATEQLLYHNLKHTESVLSHAVEVSSHYNLGERECFIVSVAVWFHDIGYSTGVAAGHEQRGAALAGDFLRSAEIDERIIAEVEGCILATICPQNPKNFLQQVICDADLFHFGTPEFSDWNKLVRKEAEQRSGRKMDKAEWRKSTIALLESHTFQTDYCRDMLDKQKQKNIKKLKEKELENSGLLQQTVRVADNSVIEAVGKPFIPATAHEITDIRKIKNDRPDKGTETINLYGNADDDEFIITGDVKKGITIRVIGGTGKDIMIDSSRVHTGRKKTIIYDDLKNNTVNAGPETKDKRTSDYDYNSYERRSADSNYDITLPIPIAGFNPDDGVFFGANMKLTKYGFKKTPYASIQTFGGSFAFNTKAFRVNYSGDFIDAFEKFDFYLDTYYRGPTYAFNYAGLGNETVRGVDNPNFYRARQSALYVFPALKKRFAGNSGFIALGPFAEVTDLEETSGRFIASSGNGLNKDIFKTKYFTGAKLLFDFSSVDNLSAPHTGIKFNSNLNWTTNPKTSASFASWHAQFTYYTALDTKENIILATQIGTGINFGDGYEFFQMSTIGGKQGLRGYRTERFYGKSSLWHDTDLRVRIGSSENPTLPLTYGIFGSFDYGRVWLKQLPSQNWHFNYGGGIWLAPVDFITLAAGAFIPKEKTEEKPRISFQIGFWF